MRSFTCAGTPVSCSIIEFGFGTVASPVSAHRYIGFKGRLSHALLAQGVPFIVAEKWQASPDYIQFAGNGNNGRSDIAVVVLKSAAGVPAVQLYRKPVSFADYNRVVRVVGYGKSGPSTKDIGIKRKGIGVITFAFGDGFVRLAGQSTQCYGDSGGPSLIVDSDGVEKVLGVSSHLSQAGVCNDNWNALAGSNSAFLDGYTKQYQ